MINWDDDGGSFAGYRYKGSFNSEEVNRKVKDALDVLKNHPHWNNYKKDSKIYKDALAACAVIEKQQQDCQHSYTVELLFQTPKKICKTCYHEDRSYNHMKPEGS